jgi:allantoate deiminase
MSENAATAGRQASPLGDEIVSRINRLAEISETPDNLTRIFLTPEHRAAAGLIMSWMVEAGMSAHLMPSAMSAAAMRANAPACRA